MLMGHREILSARSLVYVKGRWLKPSDCLWNCSVEILGCVPLEKVYPGLRKFFVEEMRVMTMNANVLAKELAKTSKASSLDIDELKRIILVLGQILAADPAAKVTNEHLDNLRKAAFLPVREQDVCKLKNINADFCINDHKRYGDAFRGKARMLDFDYEDLTSLHPLFKLLTIENKYISGLVEAHTTVESFCESRDLTKHLRERAYAFSWYVIRPV
jgi:hypothetical protein